MAIHEPLNNHSTRFIFISLLLSSAVIASLDRGAVRGHTIRDIEAVKPEMVEIIREYCPGKTCSYEDDHTPEICSLKISLHCYWTTCDWWGWLAVEDWYSTKCGLEADNLSYDGLPACMSRCVQQNLIDYGCITEGRNCFCLKGTLFDCQNDCGTQSERTSIKGWLMDQCNISATLAEQGAISGTFTEAGSNAIEATRSDGPVIVAKKAEPPKWYEIFAVTVLVVSFVACVLIWIAVCFTRRRSQTK